MLKNIVLTIVLALILLLTYGFLIEPSRVVVKEVVIPAPRLAEFFGDATVVHLSDFQSRGWGLREMQVVSLMTKLEPDYVFITGDFAQASDSYEPVMRLLEQIPATEGIFGVLGNTDYNERRNVCVLCHEDDLLTVREGPIRVLRNETIRLKRGGRELALVGLDRYDEAKGASHAYDAIRNAPYALPKIVLAHTPYYIEDVSRRGTDLYLAGDTHGGQVALPRSTLAKLNPTKDMRYPRGLFEAEGIPLYVSSGIGWNEVPVRIGVRPEIVVLKFREEGS
ncbi:MAG: hypothetical protein HKN20_07060 [Gemmatimonadetes bacterium]|nr:hypothetical protein [Gemmatimonadota bacterium]